MKIILFILVFLIIGALFIITNQNLAINEPENFSQFSEMYQNWFDKLFNNTRTITGEVIGLEWLP